MPRDGRTIVVPWLVALAIAGCNAPIRPLGRSPLSPAQMSSDSVVLEMFFVRFPFGDATVNNKLWKQIDEQPFSAELRQRWTKNGFRVGLLNEPLPEELSKLMQLADKSQPDDEISESKVKDLGSEPRVIRRHLQIRAGQRSEILASGVYDELPLLLCEQGQLCGQTYYQAQGVFAVKSFPESDGRVRLELTPELQHDRPRQRWVGNQGILRLDASRPKREFDDMTVTAELSPGAMLVLSSLPNRSGSLGHHFFTEKDGRLEQKLLLIRLAQTQHDGLFNPPESSPDEASATH
ncbi:MAG: hypothetical protein ABFC54_02890 [Thermoguttaceae bacterium]